MLILTRKPDEEIIIQCPDGTIIRVVMVELESNHRARVGIDAPITYRVDRKEIFHLRKGIKDAACNSNISAGRIVTDASSCEDAKECSDTLH
jgi:sRNA-binding carbon storage regulator CsrA